MITRAGGETLVDLIELLLDSIWRTEQIPDKWRVSILRPFHKRGDSQVCSNYRGISLLCIELKILETILLARLTEAYEPHTRDIHAGYKKKSGCREKKERPSSGCLGKSEAVAPIDAGSTK